MRDEPAEVAPAEPNAAGEVVPPRRFGVGARATILLGLAMGAMTTVITAISDTVSRGG
jgi:hypothetical protein